MNKYLILKAVNDKDYYHSIVTATSMDEASDKIDTSGLDNPEHFTIVSLKDPFTFNEKGHVKIPKGRKIGRVIITPLEKQ